MLPQSEPLTTRESQAIWLSTQFGDTAEVALAMGIKPQRVRTLRHHAYRKLGVSGPYALVSAITKLAIR